MMLMRSCRSYCDDREEIRSQVKLLSTVGRVHVKAGAMVRFVHEGGIWKPETQWKFGTLVAALGFDTPVSHVPLE